MGEGEDGQELISRRDVSFNSVRVNVNRYGKPSEIQGAFLFQQSYKLLIAITIQSHQPLISYHVRQTMLNHHRLTSQYLLIV